MSSDIDIHSRFMKRCLQLARQGSGYVAPNPMVGAVLVHDGRIIGEAYHQKYGEAHAEVNCIDTVTDEDKPLISLSTLYVSLEPCSHFGKTPPCADLIIKNKIPKVVIGCRDPFKEVDGKGIEKLKAAGVEVIVGILEDESKELNKRFITFHELHRPYIILKWAQTADGKIAAPLNPPDGGTSEVPVDSKVIPGRLFISNEYSNRLVHKWRSEEAAILIGTSTALLDDPELTTRLWTGPSPVRLVVDMDLKLPSSLKIFKGDIKTIVFNTIKHDEKGNSQYYQVTEDVSLVHQITNALYQLKIQSVIVEGGAKLIQSFIDEGMWDEARIIKNEELIINNGLSAPVLEQELKVSEDKLFSDIIEVYKKKDLSADHYNTPEKPSLAEFKDRGSKFIAYAFPITDVNEFKAKLTAVKKEHPKATHHCFAYRLGTDGNNFRTSDDGEPSGTAGKPILGQIDSRRVTNVLIIVVRYFGGTQLGVPGLINAYKTAASLALQVVQAVQKPILINYRLQFDYTQMNDVMKIIKQFDCIMLQKDIQLFCVMRIGIAKKNMEEVLNKLKELRGVEVEKVGS